MKRTIDFVTVIYNDEIEINLLKLQDCKIWGIHVLLILHYNYYLIVLH